jgi:hypothetical protein
MSIRNIFAEQLNVDSIESVKHCPSSLMKYIEDENGNIITKLTNDVITISGDRYSDFSFDDVPICDPNFFTSENTEGCCKKQGNASEEYKDHNMGYKYLFKPLYTSAGIRRDVSYNIYHKQPVQTLFSFLDDPNKITKFFKLIFASSFLLMLLAILGSCYEFWLRYGNSIDCLYYIGKCKNIGDESKSGEAGKVNLIDYVFPNSITYYPYQKCETNKQSGGNKQKGGGLMDSLDEKQREGFHSNYISYKKINGNTTKCITLNNDDFNTSGRPFPYNIADFDIESKGIKIILKFICFLFLFPVLITRIILNKCLTYLSSGYQTNVRNNVIISNIIFALFIGAIPLNLGGITLLSGIVSLIGIITPSIGAVGSLILILFPERIKDFKRALENYNDGEVSTDYYKVLKLFEPDGYFYTISNVTELKEKVKKILVNILSIIPFIICMSIGVGLGSISNLIATIYMTLSTIFNFFYIPFQNSLELLDILKDHSSLLTILLCLTVVASSSFALDGTTTSIMSSLVAILILYKVLTYNK